MKWKTKDKRKDQQKKDKFKKIFEKFKKKHIPHAGSNYQLCRLRKSMDKNYRKTPPFRDRSPSNLRRSLGESRIKSGSLISPSY